MAGSKATHSPTDLLSPEPVLLHIRATARLLGLTYWKVYGLVKARELPVVEIGGKFYFRRATILKWVEKSEAKVAA
jgi:excisionase family DNA binding protein